MPAPLHDPLAAYAGRPLLCVFAPSDVAAAFEQQDRLLGPGAGSHEPGGYVRLDLFRRGTSRCGRTLIAPDGADAVRSHFGVAPGAFAVIVADAEGHVVCRSDAPLTAAAVRDRLGAVVA